MYEWMGKKKMETFGENHWALSGSLSPPEASVSKQGQRGGHIFSLSLFFPQPSLSRHSGRGKIASKEGS